MTNTYTHIGSCDVATDTAIRTWTYVFRHRLSIIHAWSQLQWATVGHFLTGRNRTVEMTSQQLRKLLKIANVTQQICTFEILYPRSITHAREHSCPQAHTHNCNIKYRSTRRKSNIISLPQCDWRPRCNKAPPGPSVRRDCRSLSDVPGSDSGSRPPSWRSTGDGQQRSLSDLYTPEHKSCKHITVIITIN